MSWQTNVEVGRLITAARLRRGWTKDDLARELGEHRSRSTISKAEAGQGVGFGALLDVIELLPEVGGGAIKMIRTAQRAHYLERPGRSPTEGP
jgi:DNA-binding XRE family transcriptional regulator